MPVGARMSAGSVSAEEIDEVADGVVRFDPMAEVGMAIDSVGVAPTDLLPDDDARLLEVLDDPEHRSLRDADALCDVAQARIGIVREAHQDMAMVGQEGPGGAFGHVAQNTCPGVLELNDRCSPVRSGRRSPSGQAPLCPS
jgi:hypothetical protein